MALPPLEYSGQSASEILACKDTHTIASVLFALEEGIHLRQSKSPETKFTNEERLLLGVLALWREVNNGGFAQFFVNSSRQYAPDIVPFLRTIGCNATAAITEQAIACLGIRKVTSVTVSKAIRQEDSTRDERLEQLDHEFYALSEIEQGLFQFVEEHSRNILLERTTVAPREPKRGVTNAGRLALALRFARPAEHSLACAREQAIQLASAKGIAATEEDYDGAAYLYLFAWFLNRGDLSSGAAIASRTFELCREDTTHCVQYRQWIEKMLEASLDDQADEAALRYLEYLCRDDKTSQFIRKRVGFFAAVLRPHAGRLPKSTQYLNENFTEAESEPPLVIYKGLRALLRGQPSG